MVETRFQKQDRQKRERIGIALKKVQETETPKDLALWVTHDGMELFESMMGGMMKKVAKEVFMEAFKEMIHTVAEEQIRQLDDLGEEYIQPVTDEPVEFELTPFEVPPVGEQVGDKPTARPAWTDAEDHIIIECMTHSDNIKDGFEAARVRLNEHGDRTILAIRNRWYTAIKPKLDDLYSELQDVISPEQLQE